MKLVFIYGPPATGKLTVAQELQKLTGYKLFHNQLTVDLALSILEWEHKHFQSLTTGYRLETFKQAALAKVKGIIFTFVYAKKIDDKFVKQVVQRVKKDRGQVCFVQLRSAREELFKRVKNSSRKRFRKLTSKSILKSSLKRNDLYSPIPFVKSHSIDNSKIPAKKVAHMIKTHYKL